MHHCWMCTSDWTVDIVCDPWRISWDVQDMKFVIGKSLEAIHPRNVRSVVRLSCKDQSQAVAIVRCARRKLALCQRTNLLVYNRRIRQCLDSGDARLGSPSTSLMVRNAHWSHRSSPESCRHNEHKRRWPRRGTETRNPEAHWQ